MQQGVCLATQALRSGSGRPLVRGWMYGVRSNVYVCMCVSVGLCVYVCMKCMYVYVCTRTQDSALPAAVRFGVCVPARGMRTLHVPWAEGMGQSGQSRQSGQSGQRGWREAVRGGKQESRVISVKVGQVQKRRWAFPPSASLSLGSPAAPGNLDRRGNYAFSLSLLGNVARTNVGRGRF